MKKTVNLSLDDLRVESFDTLPELSDREAMMAVGARAASSCDGPDTCFRLCTTGDETVVCVDPSGGGDQIQ